MGFHGWGAVSSMGSLGHGSRRGREVPVLDRETKFTRRREGYRSPWQGTGLRDNPSHREYIGVWEPGINSHAQPKPPLKGTRERGP